MKSKEKVRAFLQESFPQVDISDLVTEEEIERFANSSGGVFPNPQCCNAMHYVPTVDKEDNNSGEKNGQTAVVLVGDAVHAFPPDLGQGVNSALEDVYLLHHYLMRSSGGGFNVSQALSLYEKNRLPDIKALITLMKIGYPYQYNQAWKL